MSIYVHMMSSVVLALSPAVAFASPSVPSEPASSPSKVSMVSGVGEAGLYCDVTRHCCPEWLVDEGGLCMRSPIG